MRVGRNGSEFLTGMRTGEATIRRFRDIRWDVKPLARLIVGTAWSTRSKVEKDTKTHVERWIPVHPALAEILRSWMRQGFAKFFGARPRLTT